MSAYIDWFGFSEGATSDNRGTLTLVGFNPAFLTFDSLPGRATLALVLSIADDETPEPVLLAGREITFDVRINDPAGRALTGTQQTVPLSGKKYENLPTSSTLVMASALDVRRYGRYEAHVAVTVSDTDVELTATREIHIIQP